ncbi:MAG: putative Ig domain-containing protein, partial [Acidimicrobiales bacterium]
GTLPSGVTFTNNGNGTATLAGTTSAGGAYPITISAVNGTGTTTQAFTLNVAAVPAITSAASTTFTVGQAASFTVTTSGNPTPALTDAGTLPSGVTFTDNGNGTATLTGTLTSASVGAYPVSIKASNTNGSSTQAFTLTVISGSLAITSAASTSFTAGVAGSFTVTATGTTTPAITEGGALPAGITFTAATNGTATLAGTPAATDSGTYSINLFATNSSGKTSQAFVITVSQVPTITSAASATETAAAAFTFTVSTTAYPTAALAESGTLPSGVTFKDNGNGTAAISGSAAASTTTLTLKATNTGGSATQTFTLTIKAAGTSGANVPVFTSAASTSVATNATFDFEVTTVANSQSATFTTNLKESGKLPSGVSFSNNGDGTADITGPANTTGVFPITITATNSAGATTQSFVLTVTGAPTITTAASQTATVGSTFGFTVRTSGSPVPALSEGGSLPAGLTFTDNGNGTATISGTPDAGTGGIYAITITATSSGGTATQAFKLTVSQTPAITSKSSATATHGTAFSFVFAATGYPIPTITHTGTVSGLTWSSSSNGMVTLSGTPKTAGTYTLTVTATNSGGSVKQTFTLTVT